MKSLVIAAAAAAAMMAATGPALAQDWGWNAPAPRPPCSGWRCDGWRPPPPPRFDDGGVQGRLDRMRSWIDSGRAQGWLSPWDARGAYGELHAVGDRLRQVRWSEGGDLDPGTRYALNGRLDRLADRLRQERQAAW